MDIFGLREKIIEAIGAVSYDAWFKAQPEVMEGHRVKFKAREAAKMYSPFYGVLVIEASSRFYRDSIISKFGEKLHLVAKELGYSRIHIISAGEEIPQAEPPLTPEQWSELKGVLAKIGNFARSAGNHKASSALFTPGIEEDIVEDQKPKLTPRYVYPVIIHQPTKEMEI